MCCALTIHFTRLTAGGFQSPVRTSSLGVLGLTTSEQNIDTPHALIFPRSNLLRRQNVAEWQGYFFHAIKFERRTDRSSAYHPSLICLRLDCRLHAWTEPKLVYVDHTRLSTHLLCWETIPQKRHNGVGHSGPIYKTRRRRNPPTQALSGDSLTSGPFPRPVSMYCRSAVKASPGRSWRV